MRHDRTKRKLQEYYLLLITVIQLQQWMWILAYEKYYYAIQTLYEVCNLDINYLNNPNKFGWNWIWKINQQQKYVQNVSKRVYC